MRGNMKLDRKVRYLVYIIIVLGVYALLFELCRWEVRNAAVQPQDIEGLLCVLSGFPTGVLMELSMLKWLLAFSVVVALVESEIYARQNHLKYIAIVRYGSYRRFYRSLMNRTAGGVLLYGSTGMLITYVLYACGGNGQVGGMEFLEMCMIYLSQLLLVCLLQTLCMILAQGYTASVILLVLWFAMAVCGHLVWAKGWIWLPANWGMYIRGEKMLAGGVPGAAYGIQIGLCILLWAGVPLLAKGRGSPSILRQDAEIKKGW